MLSSLRKSASVNIMHALTFLTCTRMLALVQSRFTDGKKYDATHNMFLNQYLTCVPAEVGIYTLRSSKVFTVSFFSVLE